MMRRFSRRGALGLGAAGLGSLLLPSLTKEVRAQEANDRRKVLFIYADAGWTSRHTFMRPPWAPPEWSVYNPWHPDFSTKPDTLEWEFDMTDSRLTEADFSPVLKPFYRHRQHLTMLEGLAMLSTALDKFGDGHAKGHLGCMSGTPSASAIDGTKSNASTASMDQRINEFIRLTSPDHDSLNFRMSSGEPFHAFVYRSDGNGGAVRLACESDPRAAFNRLFGNVTPTGSGDPLDAGRNFAFATALAQFNRMAPKLSSDDRLKLQTHRDMFAQLQRRLGQTVNCAAPAQPGDTTGLTRGERFETNIDAFGTMIATAFGCGLSRVASLGLTGVPPELYGLAPEAAIHEEYEHPSDPFKLWTEMKGTPTEEWTRAENGMLQRNIYQAEQVAKIIDILSKTPDGDGTLMDTTLVVYVSELSHGSHGHEHYPIMLFGKLDGVVTPGRYIKYKQDNPIPYPRNYSNEFTGQPHSHLFVSICQAFGMEIDHLEGAEKVQGNAVHANVKAEISLSGPLPRLKV
jgi:hypothetical protein